MPIYAYRCDDCGLTKDVLQKMSDDVLTICPECGHSNFKKQVTAAGFQLKGSGWYVTDFREGNKPSTTNSASSETKIKAESNDSSTTKATTADSSNNSSKNIASTDNNNNTTNSTTSTTH